MKRILFLLGLILLFSGFGDGDAINNNRGNGYFNKGDYKKAAQMYDKIKDKRNRFIAEYNRGNALIKSGDLKTGLSLLADVAENGDTNIASKAYYNMGNALFNAQKYKEAVNMYVNSLKLKPDFNNAKYNLEKTLRLIKKNKQKNKNNSHKNKQNKQNKNKKKQNKQNGNQNSKRKNKNQRENASRPKMSKKEAERILNALMRNRKKAKKDSTALKKFLSPRYTW